MLMILTWSEKRGKDSSREGGEGRREKEVGEEEEKEEGWMWSAVRLRDIDQGCCRHLRPTHSPTAILHLNPTCKQTSSG